MDDDSVLTINGINNDSKILNFFPKKKIVVTDKNEEFSISIINVKSNGITIIDCQYGKQEYKGDFIINIENNNLMVINRVPIDDYFSAVLGAEMGERFSMETLKAMAISVRSYYYSKKEKYKDQNFDINNRDGLDMVYRGAGFATRKMYEAFNKTENLFLIDKNNHIASPLFHSTSGGVILKDIAMTSGYNDNIGNVILTNDKDKFNVPLSINSPYFVFSITLDEKIIREIINEQFALNKITDIKLKYFHNTPCVDFIGFVDQNSGTHWLKCYKFISLVQQKGYNKMRSIQFKLIKDNDNYFFYGNGFGHLCGMSQYSAEQMAKNGADYKEILKKYYPNLKIKKIRK